MGVLLMGALFGSPIFAKCGFSQMIQHLANPLAAHRLPAAAITTCQPEQLYDSSKVQVHLTPHFRIYYTLTGPHAVADSLVDTLAFWLEKAYERQTLSLGLRPPLPTAQTHHYQRSDFPHLYPVEIIEMTLLRDTDKILGGPCYSCYGLTYAAGYTPPDASQLFIDNDFLYPSASAPSVESPSQNCSYSQPNTPITSNGVDYSQKPATALQVTATHELYHASQIRYLDYRVYSTFWFEASATGNEEMGAPHINDYWQYLSSIFQYPPAPVTRNYGLYPYGQSTLFLYLYATQGPQFDSQIWESFAQHPEQDFPIQWQRVAQKQGLSADSLFHDYALQVFFSGARHVLAPNTLFANDQPSWPLWKFNAYTPLSSDTAIFTYGTVPSSELPYFGTFTDRSSLIVWNADQSPAQIFDLNNPSSLSFARQQQADSAVVVSSRLRSNPSSANTTGLLKAWPNPWNLNQPVCFGPLQTTHQGVEIRSADGHVLIRLPRGNGQACWDGTLQGRRIAPGVLHWRTLPHGKNRVLLVIF